MQQKDRNFEGLCADLTPVSEAGSELERDQEPTRSSARATGRQSFTEHARAAICSTSALPCITRNSCHHVQDVNTTSAGSPPSPAANGAPATHTPTPPSATRAPATSTVSTPADGSTTQTEGAGTNSTCSVAPDQAAAGCNPPTSSATRPASASITRSTAAAAAVNVSVPATDGASSGTTSASQTEPKAGAEESNTSCTVAAGAAAGVSCTFAVGTAAQVGASSGHFKRKRACCPANLGRPDISTEEGLRERYCSALCFQYVDDDKPLPRETLQRLVDLKVQPSSIYSTKPHAWSPLHFACAKHSVELVKQLLDAGASAFEPEATVQPLHLACMPRVRNAAQYEETLSATSSLQALKGYISRCGPGCVELVTLLLERGADPNALAGLGPGRFTAAGPGPVEQVTPLHIVSCWLAGDVAANDRIYNNQFMGEAYFACPQMQGSGDSSALESYARSMLDKAASGLVCLDSSLTASAASAGHSAEISGGQPSFISVEVEMCLHQLKTVAVLHAHGADLNAQTQPHMETPLMLAAGNGNAAVVDLLCRMGASIELARADGARALEIAAAGHCRVGWTLLCHGAHVLPQLASKNEQPVHSEADSLTKPAAGGAVPLERLLFSAVGSGDRPWNLRFLQRLLADWAPLEDIWPETGETPLLYAIRVGRVEMVRLLVKAGAIVNGCTTLHKAPVLAHAFICGTQSQEAQADIVEILIDAGADLSVQVVVDGIGKLNLVQLAALQNNEPATHRLVEAGVSWQLPINQRRRKLPGVTGDVLVYAPELLAEHSCTARGCAQMKMMLGALELAGRTQRTHAENALKPWMSPGVCPAARQATVRALQTSGKAPGKPPERQRHLQPAPVPLKPARWSGCLQQQLQGGLAAGPVSMSEQQHQPSMTDECVIEGSWPALNAAEARSKGGAKKAGMRQVQQQQQKPQEQPAHVAEEDIDALLAALGEDAPASSKPAASKKKKKETAAQREAKKQEKLRLQRLQEQQQSGGGSGVGGEAEGEDSGTGGRLFAAAAVTEASSGAVTVGRKKGGIEAGGGAPKAETEATAATSTSAGFGGRATSEFFAEQGTPGQATNHVQHAYSKAGTPKQRPHAEHRAAGAVNAAQQPTVPPQMQQQQQHVPREPQDQQEVPVLPHAMLEALAAAARPAAAGSASPRAELMQAVGLAGSSKSPGGVKGPKLCVACGQRRSNMLLMPCKHMVLCDACADVDSCPSCGQPCKQRVKVHQS